MFARIIHTRERKERVSSASDLAYSFGSAKYECNIRDNISDGDKEANIALVITPPLVYLADGVSNLLRGDFNARIMQIEANNPCIFYSPASTGELL